VIREILLHHSSRGKEEGRGTGDPQELDINQELSGKTRRERKKKKKGIKASKEKYSLFTSVGRQAATPRSFRGREKKKAGSVKSAKRRGEDFVEKKLLVERKETLLCFARGERKKEMAQVSQLPQEKGRGNPSGLASRGEGEP